MDCVESSSPKILFSFCLEGDLVADAARSYDARRHIRCIDTKEL